MAKTDQLLNQIADAQLRAELKAAIEELKKEKSFGLVFEEHLPEFVPLPGLIIRPGDLISRLTQPDAGLFRVTKQSASNLECVPLISEDSEPVTVPTADAVLTRRFGDPIYPALIPVDSVRRNSERPAHILIEADNYHALQLLTYTHERKVDVIYIDPPYNTGARDWKYNNNYVDGNDRWRHSKWLSFMKRRLLVAKKLLKQDAVLICTIDEHEIHHLACLLEQIFPESRRQVVTIVNNGAGVSQGGFYRVEEFAIFCFFGSAKPVPIHDDLLSEETVTKSTPIWFSLIRYGGINALPSKRSGLVYPIAIDPADNKIVAVGKTLKERLDAKEITGDIDDWRPSREETVNGYPVVWPFRRSGTLSTWQLNRETLQALATQGLVRVRPQEGGPGGNAWSISYVKSGNIKKIRRGEIKILGREEKGGALILGDTTRNVIPKTVWKRARHDAGKWGSRVLRDLLGNVAFDYPKSPYAVLDTLSTVIADRPDAVILDFFGGSGTTLNAIALLNTADGGRRQCIIVTNNEVSEKDSRRLEQSGIHPGNSEWRESGICKAVTWPRIKAMLTGERSDRSRITGDYYTGRVSRQEVARSISLLSFADGSGLNLRGRKDVTRLVGGLPLSAATDEQDWLLAKGLTKSILWNVDSYDKWIESLAESDDIEELYVVTTDVKAFQEIAEAVNDALGPLTIEKPLKQPMGDGFDENAYYLELAFVDPNSVALGAEFKAILPILWMKAGAVGNLELRSGSTPWLFPKESPLAILIRESKFSEFFELITKQENIQTVFLVTDSEESFREMQTQLGGRYQCFMLYKSYLVNFRINTLDRG